jgi:hypothetical protein
MLPYMLISLMLGAVTEGVARLFKLWVYEQSQTALLNIVAVFGFVMGAIASLVPHIGFARACALAAAVGFAYEVINLRVLHWWRFPDERLLFVRGHHAIVLVLALLWGVVPLVTAKVHAAVWHPGAATSIEARLEQLNQQEKRLLEALDGIREKERALEARLEQVRHKKQVLLDRQAVHVPRPRKTAGENP